MWWDYFLLQHDRDQFQGTDPFCPYSQFANIILSDSLNKSSPIRAAVSPFHFKFIWQIPISRGFIFPRFTVPSELKCVGFSFTLPVLSHAQIGTSSGRSCDVFVYADSFSSGICPGISPAPIAKERKRNSMKIMYFILWRYSPPEQWKLFPGERLR